MPGVWHCYADIVWYRYMSTVWYWYVGLVCWEYDTVMWTLYGTVIWELYGSDTWALYLSAILCGLYGTIMQGLYGIIIWALYGIVMWALLAFCYSKHTFRQERTTIYNQYGGGPSPVTAYVREKNPSGMLDLGIPNPMFSQDITFYILTSKPYEGKKSFMIAVW